MMELKFRMSTRLVACLLYLNFFVYLKQAMQIECHPYLPRNDLRDYCHKNGIFFQAYSSLGTGSSKVHKAR